MPSAHDKQNAGQRYVLRAQGSLSYGYSKGTKKKKFMKKIVYPSFRLVFGDRFFLDAAKNGTIFSRN